METSLLTRVKESIQKIESTAEIILYGSRARNDFQSGADWDFFVVVDGPVDYKRTDRIRHELHEIEWDTGEVLCAIVRSRDDLGNPRFQNMPLYKNIKLEGIKL